MTVLSLKWESHTSDRWSLHWDRAMLVFHEEQYELPAPSQVSKNDRKCKYNFMIPFNNSAHNNWNDAAVKNSSIAIFSQDRSTLLVCCLEGQVLEIETPEEGKFDTSKTYQITGLNIRQHEFKSIKSRLRVCDVELLNKQCMGWWNLMLYTLYRWVSARKT